MIEFFVLGSPAPSGSKSGFPFKRKGGGIGVRMVDACKRAKPWKTYVAVEAAKVYRGPLFEGPLSVHFHFYVVRPMCHHNLSYELNALGKRMPYPTPRPDVLKLTRAVEDALTGVIWKDDSQICQEEISKEYADDRPVGVRVQVYHMI